MTNISISIEATPNPQTLKFRFSEPLLDSPIDCPRLEDAEKSPLAQKIFGFPWTSSVFLGCDFISITKQDWVDWDILAEPLASLIRSHIENDEPITADQSAIEKIYNDDDDEIVKEIKKFLHKEIRPLLAYDGGDVQYESFVNGQLYLRFKGACSSCPSKSVTLKGGIETRLKENFPEITEVLGN